jgi:hypothetical protein
VPECRLRCTRLSAGAGRIAKNDAKGTERNPSRGFRREEAQVTTKREMAVISGNNRGSLGLGAETRPRRAGLREMTTVELTGEDCDYLVTSTHLCSR